jgi:hypothetical protein
MDFQRQSWLSASSTLRLRWTPCHLLDYPSAFSHNYAGRLEFPVRSLPDEPAFFFHPAPNPSFFADGCSGWDSVQPDEPDTLLRCLSPPPLIKSQT